jgi:protoheme IX farnesyltransferase
MSTCLRSVPSNPLIRTICSAPRSQTFIRYRRTISSISIPPFLTRISSDRKGKAKAIESDSLGYFYRNSTNLSKGITDMTEEALRRDQVPGYRDEDIDPKDKSNRNEDEGRMISEPSTSTGLYPNYVILDAQPRIPEGYKLIPPLTFSLALKYYRSLSKFRLSSQVVLSAMAGYTICPSVLHPLTISPTSQFLTYLPPSIVDFLITPSLPILQSTSTQTVPVLISLSIGTFLCSASANSMNQLLEAPYDAQMARTRNRTLPRRLITPFHVFNFHLITGISGISILYFFVNPIVAFLGFSNIILYAFVYTFLKQRTIFNTWIGSIVGAVPPLMGWSACTGSLNPFTNLGGWAMSFLLFAWQFPHFNSLAHNLREDYCKAGYKMMCFLNPKLNARVSLRYSISLIPLCCWVIPGCGLTIPIFGWLSLIPNLPLVWFSFRFWKTRGDREARHLFWCSLVHLTTLLGLMMGCKVSLWEKSEEGQAQMESVTS